jgi:hypothetical protein
MAAGVIDQLWGMGDRFDAVTERAAQARATARRERWIQRLIDRLQRGSDECRSLTLNTPQLWDSGRS